MKVFTSEFENKLKAAVNRCRDARAENAEAANEVRDLIAALQHTLADVSAGVDLKKYSTLPPEGPSDSEDE